MIIMFDSEPVLIQHIFINFVARLDIYFLEMSRFSDIIATFMFLGGLNGGVPGFASSLSIEVDAIKAMANAEFERGNYTEVREYG